MNYVREHVLIPAGMTHTVVDDRFAIIPFRTRFYTKDSSGAITNADFLDSSYKIPGGGWLSSADDLARFEVAMLNDSIVTRATRDVMWTPQKSTDGKENYYALGWGTVNGLACQTWARRKPAGNQHILHDCSRAPCGHCRPDQS